MKGCVLRRLLRRRIVRPSGAFFQIEWVKRTISVPGGRRRASVGDTGSRWALAVSECAFNENAKRFRSGKNFWLGTSPVFKRPEQWSLEANLDGGPGLWKSLVVHG